MNNIESKARAISTIISTNMLSIGAILFALYVLFAVPQISNLWMQLPPFYGGWIVSILFVCFVTYLAIFYSGSLILNHDWIKYGSKKSDSRVWNAFVYLPKVASMWLNSWVFGKHEPTGGLSPRRRTRLLMSSCLCLLISLLIYGLGADRIGSRYYTLAGAYCQFIGVWFAFVGFWLVGVYYYTKTSNNLVAVNLLLHVGRVLSWFLATSLAGELLWIGASYQIPFLSFRLFSIWAVIETLVAIILVAQLLDTLSRPLPGLIRLGVGIALLLMIWKTTKADLIDDSDVKQHLSPTSKIVPPLNNQQLDQLWFDTFDSRLKLVDEGPYVLLAASGGGSRAAIFTALCLSLLERTPVDPKMKLIGTQEQLPRPRTWADQIVLISSVSGGSLASAYWLQKWGMPENEINDLIHSTKKELIHYLEQFSRKSFLEYPVVETASQRQQTQPFKEADPVARLDIELKQILMGVSNNKDAESRLEFGNRNIDRLLTIRQQLKQSLLLLIKPESQSQKADGGSNLAQSLLEQPNVGGTTDDSSAEVIREQIKFINNDIVSLDQFFACYWTFRYFHLLKLSDADESKLDTELSQLSVTERENLLRYRWIFRNGAFDAMCMDFMAPILRGFLAPTLDRGDALAKFWTERFGWQDCTNMRGFAQLNGLPSYSQGRPLAIFNACDAAMGCRLAIGFPDLPRNLWKSEFIDKSDYHSPESYREVAHPVELSLSRAVRFSSNFPFGFRAQQLKAITERESVHVLDGGVSDNTGVDTLLEMLVAIQKHAANSDSPYALRCRSILDKLKKRGMIILEVDSGGKPSEVLPHGLLEGIILPIQALNNAAYSTSEIAKAHYYSEIERLLKCSKVEFASQLSVPGSGNKQVLDQELGVQYFQIPSLFVETVMQCNHYSPGQAKSDADVMTAWSLGPKDKADVIGRFLQELTHWEGKRELLHNQFTFKANGFQECKTLAEVYIAKERMKSKINTMLDKITQALSTANVKDANMLIAKIDDLNLSAKQVLSEVDNLIAQPSMDELKQWKEILQKCLTIMNRTRDQMKASNSNAAAPDLEKVVANARASIDVVKIPFNTKESLIFADPVNKFNVLKARDAQVRQYYESARKGEDKMVAIPSNKDLLPQKK